MRIFGVMALAAVLVAATACDVPHRAPATAGYRIAPATSGVRILEPAETQGDARTEPPSADPRSMRLYGRGISRKLQTRV